MTKKKETKKSNAQTVDGGNAIANDKNATINKIKALLPPGIFNDGRLDITALGDYLGVENSTANAKGYELTFPGKGIARWLADSPAEMELGVEMAQSKDFHDTGNVVIRGDNIDALKTLYQNYYGKIKMIYIDPPYNTKSDEFLYEDNFKHTDDELKEKFNIDEDTLKFLSNIRGTYNHSGWLAFMYPRLELARKLLTENGVIFIHIDDHEQANLKILCDEIFGEHNFINNISVRVSPPNGVKTTHAKRTIVKEKEHILAYGRNIQSLSLTPQYRKADKWDSHFNQFIVKKGRTPSKWSVIPLSEKLKKERLTASLDNKKFMSWARQHADCIFQLVSNTKIRNQKKYNTDKIVSISELPGYQAYRGNQVHLLSKSMKKVDGEDTLARLICDFWMDISFNNLFQEGDVDFKSGKKPLSLMKRLMCLSNVELNDTVLDFFAGSGTLGEAVMRLNSEDGGSRKFILVQSDEKIDVKSPAYKFCTDKKLSPLISSICIERINQAGSKIRKKCGNNTTIDVGYKVFSMVKKPTTAKKRGLLRVENSRICVENTLYNMIAATCMPLNTPVETIVKKSLYKAGGELFLTGNISPDKLAKYKDSKINLDGWANINLEQYLNLGVKGNDNITIVY